MMRTAALSALVLGLSLGLAACGEPEGGDDVDGAEASAALEQQRVDVRRAAADLLAGTQRALGGAVSTSNGEWRGCESAFNEEFKNFQYRATGRVDAGPDAVRPYLDSLEPALTEAGFTADGVADRPGGTTLSGTKDDLSASVSELPAQGSYVLVTVSGPCIDVPQEDREDWLRKDEATPEIH